MSDVALVFLIIAIVPFVIYIVPWVISIAVSTAYFDAKLAYQEKLFRKIAQQELKYDTKDQ